MIIGSKVKYAEQEWTVWETDDATGAVSLIRRDEHGFPIIEVVADAAKIILIVYSIWEPLKRMITDIIGFFRKKR